MLGYGSLFANIFSLLSLHGDGSCTVIAYQLYSSVAQCNDEQETNILISIYKFYIEL